MDTQDDTGRIETADQPELLSDTARENTRAFWNSFFGSIANAQALPATTRETQP